MKTLLGTKIGMTQILSEDGVAVPVTLIKAVLVIDSGEDR